jgi:hypothetical protein
MPGFLYRSNPIMQVPNVNADICSIDIVSKDKTSHYLRYMKTKDAAIVKIIPMDKTYWAISYGFTGL